MNYRKLIVPSNFMFIFDANEFKVLSILIDQDFKTNIQVKKKYYSKSFIQKLFMGGRRSLDRALETLIKGDLVSYDIPKNGLKHSYRINRDSIKKLTYIISLTNNAVVLQDFFKKFWKEGRMLDEITKEEEEYLHRTNKTFRIDNVEYKMPDNDDDFDSIDEDKTTQYYGLRIAEMLDNKRHQKYDVLENDYKNNGQELQGDHVINSRVTPKNAKNHVICSTLVRQDTNIKKISRCNLHNRGRLIEDKNNDYPETIYFNQENNSESGKIDNQEISNNTNKEEDMFNLFDELSENSNKESFLEKKKQKTFTKEAKAKNQYVSIIEQLKELQYNQHTTSSEIQEELEKDENIEGFKNILFYFSKKYRDKSCVDIDEAEKYYNELRDDYFTSSDILLNTSFLDVFKDFVTLDDKVYTFYSKIDSDEDKVAIDGLYDQVNSIYNIDYPENLNEEQKLDFIVDEFEKQYKGTGEVHIDDMNNFIRGLMKGLQIKHICGLSINQPRLAQNFIEDLVTYDEEFEYWELPANSKKELPAEKVEFFDDDIEKLDEIIESKKQCVESFYTLSPELLSEDNIFMDIFKDFRITRRMDVDNVPDMATRMLKFALIEPDDTITLEEKEKLLYAISNKLGLEYNDEKIVGLAESVIVNKVK